MLKFKILIIVIIGNLILIQCIKNESKKVEHISVRKTHHPNGIVKTEQSFLNDSIQEGLFKKFDSEGNLELEIRYSNNKQNGLERAYFKNGTLEYQINYEDGLKSGVAKWYFNNGKLSAELNYYNDKPVGELYYYNPTGKLKSYVVTDFEGNMKYSIAYLETGAVDHIGGNGVVAISSNDKNSFNVGDTLKLIFIVATPPNSDSQFFILDNVLDTTASKELSIDMQSSVVRYEMIFKNEGIHHWGGHLKVKFDSTRVEIYPFSGETSIRIK